MGDVRMYAMRASTSRWYRKGRRFVNKFVSIATWLRPELVTSILPTLRPFRYSAAEWRACEFECGGVETK